MLPRPGKKLCFSFSETAFFEIFRIEKNFSPAKKRIRHFLLQRKKLTKGWTLIKNGRKRNFCCSLASNLPFLDSPMNDIRLEWTAIEVEWSNTTCLIIERLWVWNTPLESIKCKYTLYGKTYFSVNVQLHCKPLPGTVVPPTCVWFFLAPLVSSNNG